MAITKSKEVEKFSTLMEKRLREKSEEWRSRSTLEHFHSVALNFALLSSELAKHERHDKIRQRCVDMAVSLTMFAESVGGL
jgi:hypothetical protein